MKKLLLFYLVFAFLAINARAQQNTVVTVGSATTAASSNGPIVVDLANPTGNFSRHIALYPATILNVTPFTQRTLTKIAWYKDDANAYSTTTGYLKIYVKQTTSLSLGGFQGANWTTEITGATEVANIPTPSISAGAGWKEFVLTTPIIWNGTSNLEVLVEWSATGTITNSQTWRYSAAAGNFAATTNQNITSNIFINNLVPNTQLTFSSFNNDAGISAVNSPVSPVTTPTAVPVTATIKNFGDNAVTAATIGWKVNNVAQADYTWTGNLASGATAGPLALGTFAFPAGTHRLKVYTKTVNGGADPFKFNDTTIVDLISCTPLSGTNYTVNKNNPASATNFTSFSALAQILNACGVSGPTTVTVAPNSGPYTDALSLVNVQGTSATNTITIEGSGNTLTANNTAVIKLDQAHYVKINNLVITQTNQGLLSYGVQIVGPSNFVTISNNTINMPQIFGSNIIGILTGTGSNSNTQGNYCNNSKFQNNIINGGHYSMRLNGLPVTGSTPIGAVNNQITGNQFRDFNSNGVFFSNNDGTIVEGNDFSRPTRFDVQAYNGVNISTGSINCIVSKNRFHNTHGVATSKTSGATGIGVDAAPATAGQENIIKNNLFYDFNNEGAVSGIVLGVLGTASGVHIYHNTFSIETPNRPASNTSILRALYVIGNGNNVKFVNNIVTINAPGTGVKAAVYLGAATTTFTSNNNDFYIAPGQTNAFTGFLTSGRITLADWRAANTTTPYDMNSVDFNPAYVGLATGNLKPTSPDVNNIGQPTPVLDDINGDTRSTTTPDPGAYEFTLGTLDKGITAINSPTTPTAPGVATPVTVTLKNFGTAPLTTTTIGWKVNGVIQAPFAWTGNLASNTSSAPLTIGNFTFPAGSYSICAWTVGPDLNAANDSTCTAGNACLPMAGNYTINKNMPTTATNFDHFGAAAERLHNCGVSAKVTISVVPGTGPYTENVELLSIPGVSATNRVIFQGNGNTLTSTFTATTVKTTVLKLNDADHVKFNNLNITLNSTAPASHPLLTAVQLMNNSDNDSISNCTITMPMTSASNDYIVGIFAGVPGSILGSPDLDVLGNNTSNSVFLNNTITGGLYGIKINGNAGATNAVNNRIIGNTILDFNTHGIGILNTDGCLVEGNVLKRPTLLNANSVYAITMKGESKNNRISKNRISNLWDAQASFPLGVSYAIYSTGVGAPVGSENIVSNNIINDTNTPGTMYALYNLGNSGVYYYYNTIYTINQGIAYGLYQSGFASNIKFINNNVSINSYGANNKYAIYLATATSQIQSNNNNLHVGSGSGAIIGNFQSTDFATLANWKTANSNAWDQASVSAEPFFLNVATGNFTPLNPVLNNIGQAIPAVTTDITGATRGANPDPGAYEFTPVQNDVGVVAIVSPVTGCGLTNQETVTITIKNFGAVTQTSIPVSYQLNGGTVVTGTYTGSLAFNATANYTFTTKANLSVQSPHTLIAKTILTGDAQLANDALTATVTNAVQANLPALYSFETAATGINAMRIVTKAYSNVTEGTAASFGTGTKGMIMDGVNNPFWSTPGSLADSWTTNHDNFSAAYICINPTGGAANDSLWLTFDLKQLWKATNGNTNFRVTVNGTQVGTTYRPPFAGAPIVWTKVKINLYAYKNLPTIQIGFESNVKEIYDNGNGTANLIDNIMIKRRIISGIKADVLASQIHVFPNPSNGTFNIDLPKGKVYELEVTDLTGKVIQKLAAKGSTQLNLEGTAKGIYLLKVSGDNGSAVRKLIVE